MRWQVTFEENGGYDSMSAAYVVTNTSAHRELIVVDADHYDWHRAWDPAPAGTRERMEAVANAIADALNKLDGE